MADFLGHSPKLQFNSCHSCEITVGQFSGLSDLLKKQHQLFTFNRKRMITFRVFLCISLLLQALFECALSGVFTDRSPQWLSSPLFRAGNKKLISTRTGNQSKPEFDLPFSSQFDQVPHCAYGIKGYEGDDYLGSEMFEIKRQVLTQSKVRVSIQIYGYTNLQMFNVAYVAITADFPYHLNSFDNIPINYTSGPLSNITAKSASPTRFREVINYTQQAAGKDFTEFSTPLGGNKILLFLSSLFIRASFRNSRGYFPVEIVVNYEILSTDTYLIEANLYTQASIQKLHFSQIVFNEDQVRDGNQFFLEYEVWVTNVNGGFKPIPIAFVDNFIMALFDFKTIDGKCGIQYDWNFKNESGVHGVRLEPSIPDYGDCGQNQTRSTIFYMKTWICPTGYKYFNLSSSKCQDNCGDYYFQNEPMLKCDSCHFWCQDCTDSASTSCTICADADFRLKNSTSGECVCKTGYFDDQTNSVCPLCTTKLYQCAICVYQPNSSIQYQCTQCKPGFFYEANNKKCVDFLACNPPGNSFVNVTDNTCITCSILGCKLCETLAECRDCEPTQEYFTHTSDNTLCQKCIRPTGCNFCKTLTTCISCNNSIGYYMDSTTDICVNCTFGCTSCNVALGDCQTCLSSFDLIGGSCVCQDGTYLDQTFEVGEWTCKVCHTFCELCSGPTRRDCTKCKDSQNRYLDNGQCKQCALEGCSLCETELKCQTCEIASKYWPDPANTDICKKCQPPMGCNECKTLDTCESCDETKGYYMNSTSEMCYDCAGGCTSCNGITGICDECDRPKYILDSQSNRCICIDGFYEVRQYSRCMPCFGVCKTCSGSSEQHCKSCHVSHERNLIGRRCECRDNYKEPTSSNTFVCEQIDNKTCEEGFYYVEIESMCKDRCGDGILKPGSGLECDDGNIDNGDGCDQFCQIQPDYECTYNPERFPQTLCNYNKTVQMVNLTVSKSSEGNILSINFQVSPVIGVLDELNWKEEIQIEGFDVQITEVIYDSITGKVTLKVNYDRSPGQQTITIRIRGDQTDSNETSMNPTSTSFSFADMSMENNINPGFYPPSVYIDIGIASTLAMVAMGVALGCVALSMILKQAFPIVQIVTAMQVCFLSLSTMTNLHPLTAVLFAAKSIVGFNDKSLAVGDMESPNQVTQSNVSALGYQTSFIANANVMVLSQTGLLLVSSFVYLLSIKNSTFKTPFRFFQRALMIVVLFNIANVLFSASLITTTYPLELAFASIAVATLVGQVVHLSIYYKEYLGLDKTFDLKQARFKTYLFIMIAARSSVFILPAALRDYPAISVISVLGVQGILCIAMVVLRPFAGKLFNVCMIVAEFSLLGFMTANQAVASMGDTISDNADIDLAIAWAQVGLFGLIATTALVATIGGIYMSFIAKTASPSKVKKFEKVPKKDRKKQPLKNDHSNFQLDFDDIGDDLPIR